ncbi:iron chelate uptake ABC transporter family permease subunit [uncultured Georgenia sp.]|uniref:FecCD family ABC transporter permease n=1 Tax=uncultured Georgenia sp. TaxID=378209 RepID=UPI00261D3E12|nr:iron chelate uptake ABC transporter family permease subunit [uncultured Georgenia sp.]HLV05562.1 iron chelate uptake ABC transporter family permease subunit [Actinomycetaceae bacterium]
MTTTLLPAPAPAREAVRAERRRRRWRTAVVTVALAGVVLALAWTALSWGGHAAEAADHLAGLLGGGSGEDSFTIGRIRLPRVALAVLVGVALGVAGGIFQTVLGNPLASPDILGVSGGASAAAAFAIVVLGLSGLLVGLAALLGAAAAATLIYLLAWRGGVTGYRFVLVGVGIAFAVNGLVGYLLTRSDVDDVRSVLVWMVGSIGTPRWRDVAVLAAAAVVLAPAVVGVSRRLRVLALGDETAGGLGVRVERTRLLALAVAVALAALATAFAGPVAFVAFVSAPIARRLLPTAGAVLLPAGLVGAAVILGAELAAQYLVPSLEAPVGIITGAVGACYLLWLLVAADRRGETA